MTGSVDGLSRCSWNVAAVAPLFLSIATASSSETTGVGESSSTIVTVAVPRSMVAPVTDESTMRNVSSGSITSSPTIVKVSVTPEAPAGIVIVAFRGR